MTHLVRTTLLLAVSAMILDLGLPSAQARGPSERILGFEDRVAEIRNASPAQDGTPVTEVMFTDHAAVYLIRGATIEAQSMRKLAKSAAVTGRPVRVRADASNLTLKSLLPIP